MSNAVQIALALASGTLLVGFYFIFKYWYGLEEAHRHCVRGTRIAAIAGLMLITLGVTQFAVTVRL